eukprot:c2052_g1_i1.p1 GENE.c2052_g1_i1~~c2052_g1_i1.p1  ORF type:complete len:646 (-),score=131.33 c2052_g1_i1:58-1809(-)
MYNAKPKHDAKGKVIRGGLSLIPEPGAGRIQPNRKWFGNTRVVGQKELERFREEVGNAINDPYQVLLRQKRLPMGLLTFSDPKKVKMDLLGTESFADTFGAKSKRKRPKLTHGTDLAALVDRAENQANGYSTEKDSNFVTGPEWKYQRESVFSKGTSRRIWAELYKVIDSSDVVIQVIDSRDPMGTRCQGVEKHIRENAKHKHMILVLNKCDLVPVWVVSRWVKVLSSEYPTLAFHASMQNPFGKGSLIQLLRQFAILHKDKKQISVGLIGYPNVGKSSIVNALKQKKVCKVAPIPGETKVWQYITLTSRIYLIDCPGIVHPHGDTDTDIVLKSVVRVENLDDAAQYIPAVLERVKREFILKTYRVSEWTDATDFLTQYANMTGKLLKGGEPDLNTVGKMILHDWQRGNLPWFVTPPVHEDAPDVQEPAPLAPPKKKKEKEKGSDDDSDDDGSDDDDAGSDLDNQEYGDLRVTTASLNVDQDLKSGFTQAFDAADFFVPSDSDSDSDTNDRKKEAPHTHTSSTPNAAGNDASNLSDDDEYDWADVVAPAPTSSAGIAIPVRHSRARPAHKHKPQQNKRKRSNN